jgi:hypothetical protein
VIAALQAGAEGGLTAASLGWATVHKLSKLVSTPLRHAERRAQHTQSPTPRHSFAGPVPHSLTPAVPTQRRARLRCRRRAAARPQEAPGAALRWLMPSVATPAPLCRALTAPGLPAHLPRGGGRCGAGLEGWTMQATFPQHLLKKHQGYPSNDKRCRGTKQAQHRTPAGPAQHSPSPLPSSTDNPPACS